MEQEELTELVGLGPIMTMLKKIISQLQAAVLGRDTSTEVETSSGALGTQANKVAKDPRRYKRASLQVEGAGVVQEIASASAQYRGETFSVVDLSHTGIALLRTRGDSKVEPSPAGGPPEPMTITLGMFEPKSIQAQPVRSSDRVLAFELVSVPTDARLLIDRFLDPKMIGLNMRTVDRSYFSSGETFSLWYCGPRDTNFFLWMSGSKLERALLQLGDEQYGLDHVAGVSRLVRAKTSGKKDDESAPTRGVVLFALDVALQIREGGDAVAGLVKALTEAAETATA